MNTRRKDRGTRANLTGGAAEDIVARRYAALGRPVRTSRWRGQSGEIDLIANDDAGLIFIEVKQAKSFDSAAHALSAGQMQRIVGAASEYLGSMPHGQSTPVRFDLALVDGTGDVRVIENAFSQ